MGSGVHRRLDGVGLKGNVGHEVVEAVFGDHDVVLQADAEVFFADVNARLDREHVARCDGFVPVADVVDVDGNGLVGINDLLQILVDYEMVCP